MSEVRRRKFDKDFKLETVRLVVEEGRPVAEVAHTTEQVTPTFGKTDYVLWYCTKCGICFSESAIRLTSNKNNNTNNYGSHDSVFNCSCTFIFLYELN